MARNFTFSTFFAFLLIIQLAQRLLQERDVFAEARTEAQFEKCCSLGTSWAKEGLRCEKFTGPVSGVPRVEQGLCLEVVDICCVKTYHDQQCEKGKADARKGLACVSASSARLPKRGDYHRDCCEGCKLGILAGSMGQNCAFKKFTFGIPWDPAFVQCCYEASPSTTTSLDSTDSTASSSDNTETQSSESSSFTPSSFSSSLFSSSSTYSSAASSSSFPLSSLLTSPLTLSSDSSSSFSSPSSSVSSSSTTFQSTSIPTPPLDDICQLMKGLLCSDICVPTPGSYYCACQHGSTLLEDGKTCRQDSPTDRCKSTNPCEHRCTDTGVAVRCSCDPGYELADDKRSCIPTSTSESETSTMENEEDNELSPICPAGYRYNSTSQVCNDVDECVEKNPCPGKCENTIGSFYCTKNASVNTIYEACPPGYRWNAMASTCVDVDECTAPENPCAKSGHFCVNTYGSFSCLPMGDTRSCPAGFKFDNFSQTCKDVDECAEGIHSCLEDSEECRNTDGAYECDIKCQRGFVYSTNFGSCVDIDECMESSRPCPESGTICVNTVGGYECAKSSSNSIGNVPTEKQSVLFQCPEGFKRPENTSASCIDVDECSERLHRCTSDEQCVNERGSYRCERITFNVTKEREVRNEDYDTSYNKEYKSSRTTAATFTNEIGSPTCETGYTFDVKSRRCIDIDECKHNLVSCGVGERCVNVLGTYECYPVCPTGFQLRDRQRSNRLKEVERTARREKEEYDEAEEKLEDCIDIDECAIGLHTCNLATHFCVNVNGSYTCQELTTSTTTTTTTSTTRSRVRSYMKSPIGVRSSGIQSDDRYRNTDVCELGYKKDIRTGQCVDVDECATGPGCREYELCHNTPGGYECSPMCSTGWYFSTTTRSCQDVDECLLGRHDCPQVSHKCVNTNGSFVCELVPPCATGFKRLSNGNCTDIDECSENVHNCRLSLHQYCVNREGSYECVTRLPSCSPGYRYSLQSRRCEDVDECTSGNHTCDSRLAERCVNLPGTYRCERPSPPERQVQRPACPSGFRYQPRLKKCTDIDECAEGLDECGDEICYNQPGGYSCARRPAPVPRKPSKLEAVPAPANQKCMEGTKFVRNRGCVDIDECRDIPYACSSNEQCVNTMGSYTCTCKSGFRRDNLTQACVDINECQLQNECLPSQRCDNTIGSYTCTRFLPCGTGYTLNAATQICEDDDECLTGTHDCPDGYHCRNTLGSFRCEPNSRTTTPQTRHITTTTSTTPMPALMNPQVSCPRGFEVASGGKCMDIDECQRNPNLCGRQRCVNTIGSYRCTSRVICGGGYTFDKTGQFCVDVDECTEGNHECSSGQTCENREGGYVCVCPPGHVDGPNKECVDIDECSIYGSDICGSNGRCENTVGSYKCSCENGFENVGGANTAFCQDINECQQNPGLCQQICLNMWGSYRCGCEPGFRLNSDNRTCSDIDECVEFKNSNLCIGICENTPGSYSCKCPDGYKLGIDGRTCQDIDECASGQVCRGPNEMCQNTRGSYRCNRINCPNGYHRDHERQNRCVRTSRYCQSGDLACFRMPSHYSYNFITFVSLLPIPPSGQLELFTMRGTHLPGSTVQFSMAFVEARAPPGVIRATESCFALRRPLPSQAVLVMTRSIPGPQEIELDLSMEIYHNTIFAGSAVAKLFIYVSQYEF